MPTRLPIRRATLLAGVITLLAATHGGANAQQASVAQATPDGLMKSGAPLLSRIDLATGTIAPWQENAEPRASIGGSPGIGTDARLALPRSGPGLPVKGSRFSTLMRARDLFDVGAYPARAIAKLYRLDAEGKRQGTACTAQFVGPRHLLTAAHCLIDRSVGKAHPGFEIALRYDGGRHHGILPVTAGWLPSSETTMRPSVIRATKPIDWAADCHDMALIEVEVPVGSDLGWLGMSSSATPGTTLHRFSYPQESATVAIERLEQDTTQPKDIRDHLRKRLIQNRLTEPDFSPDNLYYEYGPPDQVHDEALSERNGAILPGRSGSALIDARGNALAIMSKAVQGGNYSCRLTPGVIGAFVRIASRRRE